MVLLVRIAERFRRAADRWSPDPEFSPSLRRLAIASLLCWAGAITAGRLLAYTYTRLTRLH